MIVVTLVSICLKKLYNLPMNFDKVDFFYRSQHGFKSQITSSFFTFDLRFDLDIQRKKN